VAYSSREAEQRLISRMDRQAILSAPSPPHLIAIIDANIAGSRAHSSSPRDATSRSHIWITCYKRRSLSGMTMLTFGPEAWTAFVDGIKGGEFDLPR
jgi:hypothetical protein